MKTSELLILGVTAIGAAYVFGGRIGETAPKSAAEVLTNAVKSIPTSATNFANTQLEQFFYNNPYAAVLVGHPEWQYMTPAAGYF